LYFIPKRFKKYIEDGKKGTFFLLFLSGDVKRNTFFFAEDGGRLHHENLTPKHAKDLATLKLSPTAWHS